MLEEFRKKSLSIAADDVHGEDAIWGLRVCGTWTWYEGEEESVF